MITLKKISAVDKKDFPDSTVTIRVGRHEGHLTPKEIESLIEKLKKFRVPNKED